MFLCAPIKHFTPLSPSRTSCFRGNLLHSNLSPLVTVLIALFPYIGGCIPGPVSSDKTQKHLHYVPLSMYFMFPEDTFCKLSLKSALFPLAQVHSILPALITEILKRGRDHWRSVTEQHPRQPSLVMIFSLQITKPFEGKIQWIEVESHHLSLTTIRSSFSEIMPIHNGCLGSSNLSTFSIYKYLSSCIRQASARC